MSENSRGILFRKRNVLGAALVAGIGLGIYLGNFKGFGLGGSGYFGFGGPGEVKTQSNPETDGKDSDGKKSTDSTKTLDGNDAVIAVPDVVRVLIDDRQFLLRGSNDGEKDIPVSLEKLIEIIKQAPGDKNGVRVRIYEKANARMREEESLKTALKNAEIVDNAVVWLPLPVK